MRYLKILPILPAVVFSSENLLELEDVVVTETRHEIELKTAPSAITSVGKEELELRSRESLKDLLLFDSSLFVLRSRGSDFLGMRGFTQGRILILIDGKRLSGEVDRTFELDRITLDRVERIEVMKGPASVLYGTDALGGVVNVITREPLKREISFSLRYGSSPGEKQLSFSAYTGRVGKLNAGVFGRVKSRNAYRLPDGTTPSFQLDVKSAGLSLFHYPADGFKVRFDYDYMGHDEWGVLKMGPSNVKILHSNARQNLALSLDADKKDWRFFLRGYASLYDKDYERRGTGNQLSDFDVADRDIYVFESWFSKRLFMSHRLTLGGEVRKEVVTGTRIKGGEFRGKIIRENVSKDSYKEKIDYYAVYAQDEFLLSEKMFLIAGVRYDDSDKFESNLSPKIGATFMPSERIRIKANYARGFKTPTPRELFIFFPGFGYWIVGNPDLGSERTDNLDAALEIDLSEDITAKGGIFYTEAKDLIETSFVCMGGVPGCSVNGAPVPAGTALITFRNVGRAEIRGAELSLQGRGDKLLLGISYTYMEAKDTVRDEPLLQRPRHRAVGRVAFEEKPFRVAVFGEYVGGFLYAPDTEKSFSLVHLTFSRNIYREVKLVAGVDNLGDKRDFDLGLLGRFFWVGVQGRL